MKASLEPDTKYAKAAQASLRLSWSGIALFFVTMGVTALYHSHSALQKNAFGLSLILCLVAELGAVILGVMGWRIPCGKKGLTNGSLALGLFLFATFKTLLQQYGLI